MRRFSITGFGIVQSKHYNLVFCSFVLRIDWLKPFLTDHAITCGINGLNRFMCLWCNTTITTIERKVRFHHMLPFMTKQRCSSAAATWRLHQKFGIIDTSVSVATSDILTQRFPKWFPRNHRQVWRVPRAILSSVKEKLLICP